MMYCHKDPETKAPVYIVKNGLDPKGMEAIVEGLKDKTIVATHQQGDKLTDDTTGPRDSTVHFFEDPQLRAAINNYIKIANYQAGWRYEITGSEAFQFTKYEGDKKQHYNWHFDGEGDVWAARNFTSTPPRNLREITSPDLVGTVRKLSVSVVLNDDYEGGEFETQHIESGKIEKHTIKPIKGDVIIFPAFLSHRVKPVTKGIRYSVVAWYAGPPFK